MSMEDVDLQLAIRRYAEASADFYGATDEERNVLRREIETTILAGREPDWDAFTPERGTRMTDADLRARGLTQDEIDLVRSRYR
jgi:hypothetical protein